MVSGTAKALLAAIFGALMILAAPGRADDWEPGENVHLTFACHYGETMLELLGYAAKNEHRKFSLLLDAAVASKGCIRFHRPTETRVVAVYGAVTAPDGRKFEVYEVRYNEAWTFYTAATSRSLALNDRGL